jgi:WD40 repeat protein
MNHPPRTYDVFLSYNSRDHQAVERVGLWLKENGLTCFMDRWYLVPGTSWQSALQEALKESKAVVVFLGPGEMGRWQQRELQLALDHQTISGMPVVPVLLPGADPPLGFLSLNTWVDLRTRLDEERPLTVLAGAVRGLAPAELKAGEQAAASTVCPFRGLLPYREEDALLFFGRQDDTDRLVAAVTRHPFVAVVGASGSGKSSVVRAGLVPRLRADRDKVWDVVTMVPTARPLNSLVIALSSLVWPDLDDEVDRREKANEKTASLEKGTLSLRDLVEIALNKQPGTQRLLLVVDQWEELYTLCRDEKLIRSFTDQLLDASQTELSSVVFTCRGDFYGHVLGYRPLVERIREGAQVSLAPMNERELRQVIEAPAASMRLEFEPGLPERILGDVGEEPGRLPLLSFLLEQLWKQRRGAVLTNEAFDAMGGVEKAIATVAEDVFMKLSEPDQKRLSRLFIQLVSVGEQSEDTRRRAVMTTLGEDARPLVAKLATARLLVTSSDQGTETVEVAHEALIQHWKRSQGWVNSARGFLTWRKRLEPFVEVWRNQDPTALLRGGLLAEAQRWLTERKQDLDKPESEFIEASLRQQEEERQADLRTKRFLVRLSITAVLAACLATALGGLAWQEWGVANKNEVKALRNLSASLAAQAAAVRKDFPQRSVLLAAEAMKINNTKTIPFVISAEQSLRDSVQNLGGLGLVGHGGPVLAVAVSGDGRWLVTGSYDNTARLWDLTAKEPEKTARVLSGHTGPVNAVAVSGDGRWLVTGSWDKTARLWDLAAKEPEKTARVLSGHTDWVRAVAVSGDGRWLVTGSRDNTARLWDLTAKEPEKTARVLSGHEGIVSAVAVSGDGRWLVTGSYDNTARLWDLTAKEPEKTARVLSGHDGPVSAVAVSGDGRWLVTGSDDHTARLWDLTAKEPEKTARVLIGHDGPVDAVAFSGDGRWLVTGSYDKTARLWDLTAKEPEKTARVLSGHEGIVSAVAVSGDGRWLVTGSYDKTARLWDLTAKEPEKTARVLSGHDGPVVAVVVSGDGRWLVTGSYDKTARLWDLTAKEPEKTARVLSGHDGPVSAVAVSGDGRWLVTGSYDKTARLWDLTAKEPEKTARVLSGHTSLVSAVAFSGDGRWLVTGSYDKTARLWDLTAKEPEKTARVLRGHTDWVFAVAVSGDGRWVVTGSDDKTARLWDLTAKEPEKTARVLRGHEGPIYAVAISGDGRWLVTGSNDNNARLWDLTVKEPEKTARVLTGHTSLVVAVAVSGDGRWLVTGSDDTTARLWDLTAVEPEKTARVLSGHNGSVSAVAVSGDGRWVVTGSGDRTVRLWPLRVQEILEQAGRALGQNFTRDEWDELFPGETYRKTFESLPDPADLLSPVGPTSVGP